MNTWTIRKKNPYIPRPFLCEVCGARFIRRNTYRLHIRKHDAAQPFTCPAPNCDKVFSEVGNRKQHFIGVHLKLKFWKRKLDTNLISDAYERYTKKMFSEEVASGRVMFLPTSAESYINLAVRQLEDLHESKTEEPPVQISQESITALTSATNQLARAFPTL